MFLRGEYFVYFIPNVKGNNSLLHIFYLRNLVRGLSSLVNSEKYSVKAHTEPIRAENLINELSTLLLQIFLTEEYKSPLWLLKVPNWIDLLGNLFKNFGNEGGLEAKFLGTVNRYPTTY